MRNLIFAAALALPGAATASEPECRAIQRTVERVAALAQAVTQAIEACQGAESAVCAGVRENRQSMIEDGLLEPETLGTDMLLMTALSVELCN